MRRAVTAAIVLATAIALPAPALAQMQVQRIDDPPRYAAYWEFGGSGIFTGNFDMLVADHTSVRLGGLVFLLSDDPDVPWNGIATVNRLIGDRGHYLEIGAGLVAQHRWGFDEHATAAALTANVGYRMQTRHGFGRIALSTAPPAPGRKRRWPIAGISWGRTF